jgi:hypothetical protein
VEISERGKCIRVITVSLIEILLHKGISIRANLSIFGDNLFVGLIILEVVVKVRHLHRDGDVLQHRTRDDELSHLGGRNSDLAVQDVEAALPTTEGLLDDNASARVAGVVASLSSCSRVEERDHQPLAVEVALIAKDDAADLLLLKGVVHLYKASFINR